MSAFPLAQLPSAPPPGSFHYIFNPLIIFKRIALGLEDPIRIQPDRKWVAGNPLFDWYRRHSNEVVQCMQLRKERKAPFFHEYVTFSPKITVEVFALIDVNFPTNDHLWTV